MAQWVQSRPLPFANPYGWMRLLIEPTVSLALTLESNPGVYACLLGSGVSATSGIPTDTRRFEDAHTRYYLERLQ